MKWMLLPAGIFTADYIIKKRAESWNEEEAPEKMLGGHIILQKLHNRSCTELHGENSKIAHRCYNSCYSRNDGVLRLSYKETKTVVFEDRCWDDPWRSME